jgi:hypothetical protein
MGTDLIAITQGIFTKADISGRAECDAEQRASAEQKVDGDRDCEGQQSVVVPGRAMTLPRKALTARMPKTPTRDPPGEILDQVRFLEGSKNSERHGAKCEGDAERDRQDGQDVNSLRRRRSF